MRAKVSQSEVQSKPNPLRPVFVQQLCKKNCEHIRKKREWMEEKGEWEDVVNGRKELKEESCGWKNGEDGRM